MKLKASIFFISILLYCCVFAQGQHSPSGNLWFVPNKGQITDAKGNLKKDILYYANDGPVAVYLRNTGISYVTITGRNPLVFVEDEDDDKDGAQSKPKKESEHKYLKDTSKACRVDMDFVGASEPGTQNSKPTEGYLNYYYPQCPQGITQVKSYQNVIYKGIYPGIDVSFKGTYGTLGKGLKYDIIVSPGADPDIIKMKYTGAEKVEIADGKLLLTAFTGNMEEKIPKVYQQINGQEVRIEGKYIIYHQGKDSLDGTVVGIKIKNYNKSYPLVIDPTWGWVTYCGGSDISNGWDLGYACALDKAGNSLVTGETFSPDFPVSPGAFQATLGGTGNVFVIKFDPKGNRIWATFYGGTGGTSNGTLHGDMGFGITTDINDNVLVTGGAGSPNFPVSTGAFQTTLAGPVNAFILKFDPNGNRLWGTLYGGSGYPIYYGDIGYAITSDYLGNVAITGTTTSTNFPVSTGAFQTTLAGGYGGSSAFVVKFDPSGNRLWATYFGGDNVVVNTSDPAFAPVAEAGMGIGADSHGNLAFAGINGSSNFPVSPGCFQSTQGSNFVAELDPNGNRLWATYFNGQGFGWVQPFSEENYRIGASCVSCAVDKSDNVIIGGNNPIVVATPGVCQTTVLADGSTSQGFISKFNSGGNLIWTTFINISNNEFGVMGLSVDESNNVYSISEADPPSLIASSCSFQSAPGQEELWCLKLDSNAQCVCSTYIGGEIYDSRSPLAGPGDGLAVRNGRLLCVPYTGGGIPVTPGAFQPTDPTGGHPYMSPAVFNICAFACGDTVPPPVPKITINAKSCPAFSNFSTQLKAPCGDTNVLFQWSFPGGTPSSAVGPNVSNILYPSSGTYTVTLKYTACSTDSITQVFTITSGFHDSLAIVNPASCNQTGQATVYPVNGVAPYTYSWSTTPVQTTQTATGLSAGTYTCTVTGKGGCTDTAVFHIIPPGGLKLSVSALPVSCNGACNGQLLSIPSGGTSPYTYLWSGGTTNASILNACAGTYSITVTDAHGCKADTTGLVVGQPPALTQSTTTTIANCGKPDGGACITAGGGVPGYTYVWSNGASTTCISKVIPGTYSVIVTDANKCSDTIKITVPSTAGDTAIITSVKEVTCNGYNNGSATGGAKGGIAPYSYSWSTTPVQTTQTATGLSAGNYTLTVTDSAGCVSTAIATITQPSPVTVTVTSDTICPGQAATLTATGSGGTPGYTYMWNNNTSGVSYTTSPTTTTSYNVQATDANGCLSPVMTATVVVRPSLLVVGGPITHMCPGGSVMLSATGAGGDGNYTYAWTPAAGLSATSGANVSASPTVSTIYTITLSDGCGPPSQDTVPVIIYPAPVVNLKADTLQGCYPLCVTFSDLSTVTGGKDTSWKWNFGDGSTSNQQNPSHCYTKAGIFTVSLSVVSSNGCTSSKTINNYITTYSYPLADFSLAPQPTTIMDPTIYFLDHSTDAYGINNWFWQFGDGSDTTGLVQNPQHTYMDTGSYCVNLQVTNLHGCKAVTVKCLEIGPFFVIYVPNAFTPNADGLNDAFTAKGVGIVTFQMWIFDRWGQQLYYTNDINHGWNGVVQGGSSGQIAQEDTYVWLIEVTDVFHKDHRYIGRVTIIN